MKCHHLIATGALLAASVASAAPAAEAEATVKKMDFLEIMAKGGLMMYPLLVLSIIAVVLVLIYLLTIRRNAVVSDRFMDAAEAMIRKRDYLGLAAYCHRQNECMARVTQKTLDFLTKYPMASSGSFREVAETEGARQAGLLSSRITYLADIGALAPMIGLLGTVVGMIKAFIEISQGEVGGVRQMGLAQGVSEALIATAGGLGISIVALTFYSFFRGRVQKYIGELEAAATHLVALLHGQLERQPIHPQHPGAHQLHFEDYSAMPPHLAASRQDIQGI